MPLTAIAFICLILGLAPALLFLRNIREYRGPRALAAVGERVKVSVLIPARNEEGSIGGALEAALANEGVELEVVVLDDHSGDATARIVGEIAARDGRVRLCEAPALPAGWCGKQYACATLAGLAKYEMLVFIDADVRLAPDALGRMVGFMKTSGADLASGFPRQETVGLVEQMVIPLMHFILLGFLPLGRMRASTAPSLAAGCGQLFITKTHSYEIMGGHASIRGTLHDGLKLPRAYRGAGLKTDLFDATDVARCRMYRTAGEVWSGLAKNATEALAAPAMIAPATLLLLLGQVAPVLLLIFGGWLGLSRAGYLLAALGTAAAYLPRVVAVWRFKQPVVGALLHPLGVMILVAIQWYALGREMLGRPATWKGRAYAGRTG